MTIGILTYHRSQNYGAQLQVFALKNFLTSLGNKVCIIDYWPKYHQSLYKTNFFAIKEFKRRSTVNKLKYFFHASYLSVLAMIRNYKTNRFALKYLNLNTSKCYDVIIYGSDQIWRKQHIYPCEDYNSIYFGDDSFTSKYKIAYAASMGKIEASCKEDFDFLQLSMNNFSAISVREKDLQQFMRESFHINPHLVCDPVFLLSKELWSSLIDKNKDCGNYILMYNIARVENLEKIAVHLSKKYNLPIIEFKGYVDKFNLSTGIRFTGDAKEFINCLHNANIVVTSSFHGVALSLCFEKNFYFASTSELSNRTESLLDIVNLKERNLSTKKLEDCDFSKNINYGIVSIEVATYALESRNWLKTQLEFKE